MLFPTCALWQCAVVILGMLWPHPTPHPSLGLHSTGLEVFSGLPLTQVSLSDPMQRLPISGLLLRGAQSQGEFF